MKRFSFICLVFLLLVSNAFAGTVLEVGSDKAYKTIASAVSVAGRGDIVKVYEGVYYENINIDSKSGDAGNYITIKAEGPNVVVDAGGKGPAFRLNNAAYWIIDGFNIINGSDFGPIHLSSGCAGAIIRNNKISKSQNSNSDIYVSGSPGAIIEGNVLTSTDTIRNLCVVYSTDVTVRDNEMTGAKVPVQVSALSHRLLFERNYVHAHTLPDAGEFTSFFFRDSEEGVVRNNIFESSVPSDKYSNILIKDYYVPEPAYQNERHKIYNNTFLNGPGYGIYFQGQIENTQVYNNIVIAGKTYFFYFYSSDGQPSSNITIDYNYHYYTEEYYNGNGSSFTDGGHNITTMVDVGFLASGSKPLPYYDLKSDSPVKDKGLSGIDIGLVDYAQQPRAVGMAPDMGPLEHQGGADPLAVDITDPPSDYTTTDDKITISGTTTGTVSNVQWDVVVDGMVVGTGTATTTNSWASWQISNLDLVLGANTINVNATDGSRNVMDTLTVTRSVPNPKFYKYIEAESDTSITDSSCPFRLGTDSGASGGKYIYVCDSVTDSYTPNADATYSISIPYDDSYYLWLLMSAISSSNDALYIGFDGNFDRVYPVQTDGTYEWVKVGSYQHNLSGGAHQINLGYGERLARADRILVTNDPDFVPTVDIVDTTAPITMASLPGGLYHSSQSVTLSTNEPATIYYATDESTPPTSFSKYTSAINIADTKTLRFFAVDGAGNVESVKMVEYYIESVTMQIARRAATAFTQLVEINISDNSNIAAWFLSESSTLPATPEWQLIKPDQYELPSGTGDITLYLWLKDKSGHISVVPVSDDIYRNYQDVFPG